MIQAPDFRKFRKYILSSISIFTVAIILLYITFNHNFYHKQAKENLNFSSTHIADEIEDKIEDYLESQKITLSNVVLFQQFHNHDPNGHQKDLSKIFKNIINKSEFIFQIRYLDENGIEKVRFERFPNSPTNKVFENVQLSDKSNRDYFIESKKTKTPFFTPIEYNMENGKIQIPLIITTRYVLPIWVENEFKGSIVVNYNLGDIFAYNLSEEDFDTYILKGDIENLDIIFTSGNHTIMERSEILSDIRNGRLDGMSYRFKEKHTNTDITIFVKISDVKLAELEHENIYKITQVSLIILLFSMVLVALYIFSLKKVMKEFEDIEHLNEHLEKINSTLDRRVNKEVEESRKKDLILLEQSKLVAMGEMIGNIAHQWRQPLSIISTSSTGLLIKKEFGEDIPDDLLIESCTAINEQAQYLSQTIDTFRNFIREDKELKILNINDEIDNVQSIIEGTLKSNEINLEVDTHNNPINIFGGSGEITESMINLVNNSVDAFNSNKIQDRFIKIDCKILDGEAIITYKDNAGGIPQDILPRIFEPYFTTKHQSQGTGLGLHIVHKVVTENFKGSIYAENQSGGALFEIKIPIKN